MTTAGAGNVVPVTKMDVLAGELRFLQSTMADMQGRLDALLTEITFELQTKPTGSEPMIGPASEQDETPAEAIADVALDVAAGEIEPARDAEAIVEPTIVEEIRVDAEPLTTAEVAIEDTAAVSTDAPVATAETTELPVAESVEITTPSEPTAETVEIAAAATDGTEIAEFVALAETSAEVPAAASEITAAEIVEVPAATALPANVLVLAERRPQPRKVRTAVARVGRWAAVIALIAMGVAVAATGTGFAASGDLFNIKQVYNVLPSINQVCVQAVDACSIAPGTL